MTVSHRSASIHFIIACIMVAVGVAAATGYSLAQVDGKKAALVRHSGGKQNISGYIHIALAWGDRLTPPRTLLRGQFFAPTDGQRDASAVLFALLGPPFDIVGDGNGLFDRFPGLDLCPDVLLEGLFGLAFDQRHHDT